MEPQDLRDHGPCPSDADLVRATTGELTPAERWVMRPHLEHCPKCRASLCEILDTDAIVAQLADSDSPERLQARHQRHNDLMAAKRADREAVSPRRWFAAAAVLLVVVAGSALFRGGRAYADEVLALAAQRERAFATEADVWRFRFIPGTDGKTGAASGDGNTSTPRDNARLPLPIIHLLEERGFDLTQPMSLARLRAWRASQPDRREQVTRRGGWLVVQSATRGPLSEVELVIDESSYQLLKQAWVIAGVGRVVCERIRLEQHPVVPSREVPRAESRAESGR